MSIIFIFHSRNHVQLAAQSIVGLRHRGHVVDTFDIEGLGAREECHRLLGAPSKPVGAVESRVTGGDLVIVGCDWTHVGGSWFDTIALLRESGAIMVGLIEGCRWPQSDRYRIVDYLLSYAPATHGVYAVRALSPEVRVVGSPAIEQSLSSTAAPCDAPNRYALLNFKDIYPPYQYARDEFWIENALTACKQNELQPIISRHPHNWREVPEGAVVSSTDFSTAIRQAAVLISPTSTVVIEALAHQIPVVLYPNGNELLLEFSDPMGAFEIVRDAEHLADAIKRATDPTHCVRSAAHDFLAQNLSIDEEKPAWQRIVDAVEEIVAVEASKPAVPRGRFEFRPFWELKSGTGDPQEDSIVCIPGAHSPGHCAFGGDRLIERDGRYRIVCDVTVAPEPSAPGTILSVDVHENKTSNAVLAERGVSNGCSLEKGVSLEFTASAGQRVETRLYWHGTHRIQF